MTSDPSECSFYDPAAWQNNKGSLGPFDDVERGVEEGRLVHAKPISRRQSAWLVEERVNRVGIRREDYGTHSLRRTKPAIIYKQTGNLRAVQILLGYTKIESTVRYLGVDIEDALTLAERTAIRTLRGLTGRCRGRASCSIRKGWSLGFAEQRGRVDNGPTGFDEVAGNS